MSRQSVQVDGITLSRDQVNRAVTELAKPELFRAGDIVQISTKPGGRRLVLYSSYPQLLVKVTDGGDPQVLPAHWCTKVGTLVDGIYAESAKDTATSQGYPAAFSGYDQQKVSR